MNAFREALVNIVLTTYGVVVDVGSATARKVRRGYALGCQRKR